MTKQPPAWSASPCFSGPLELGFSSYPEYLASGLWHGIKAEVFQLHGHRCVLCRGRAQVIHHVRYTKPGLTGDDLVDLKALCHVCHGKVECCDDGRKRPLWLSQYVFNRLLKAVERADHKKASDLVHQNRSGPGYCPCGNKAPKGKTLCRPCQKAAQASNPMGLTDLWQSEQFRK